MRKSQPQPPPAPRMTLEEYNSQMESLFEQLPEEFRPFVEGYAYDRGHSAGYDEVYLIAQGLVYALKPCIDKFVANKQLWVLKHSEGQPADGDDLIIQTPWGKKRWGFLRRCMASHDALVDVCNAVLAYDSGICRHAKGSKRWTEGDVVLDSLYVTMLEKTKSAMAEASPQDLENAPPAEEA